MNVSELYSIFCVQISTALSLEKSWVVNERYGAWDEAEADPKTKFEINVRTQSPTEPTFYLTLDEAHEQANKQVMIRVGSGFKFLFVHDFLDAPWLPDGKRLEIPVK